MSIRRCITALLAATLLTSLAVAPAAAKRPAPSVPEARMSDVDEERSPAAERRGSTAERRRYNRRTTSDVTPPYFETFERIALALEGIRDELASGQGERPGSGPRAGPARGPEDAP